MNFFTALEILSSGLGAERTRMNVTASNLANANTTRAPDGGPYKRRDPVFAETVLPGEEAFGSALSEALRGVEVREVVADRSPPKTKYDPGHPDANEDGLVALPNISPVEEMVNMLTSARAYEAGVNAMSSVVTMARRALTIGGR